MTAQSNELKFKDVINDIKKKYLTITKDNRLGGSHLLNEISDMIQKSISVAPSKGITPLFVLHRIFRDIALDQEERSVTMEECRRLYNLLNKSIIKLISDLEKLNRISYRELLEDCNMLIHAYLFGSSTLH